MIASLGEYEFIVSDSSINTFTDLSFSNSASYAEHKILGKKSLLEFTNLNASSCSFKIHLQAGLTPDPSEICSYFYDLLYNHEALTFVLGSDVMGAGLWVIDSLKEDYRKIDNHGKLIQADLSLTLKEYVEHENI